MKLIYTFDIDDEIYQIEGLHRQLDAYVENSISINMTGSTLTNSTLESRDEVSENDYRKFS